MRARSWLAVSRGTLTGSALAITGSPHSRATPAATTDHRRTTWIFTKILANQLRVGQDGHMIYFAQISTIGTITAGSVKARRAAIKAVRASRQETFSRSRIGNCQ
jgi:hypothetical protein